MFDWRVQRVFEPQNTVTRGENPFSLLCGDDVKVAIPIYIHQLQVVVLHIVGIGCKVYQVPGLVIAYVPPWRHHKNPASLAACGKDKINMWVCIYKPAGDPLEDKLFAALRSSPENIRCYGVLLPAPAAVVQASQPLGHHGGLLGRGNHDVFPAIIVMVAKCEFTAGLRNDYPFPKSPGRI